MRLQSVKNFNAVFNNVDAKNHYEKKLETARQGLSIGVCVVILR
jgi:hypothetical protein